MKIKINNEFYAHFNDFSLSSSLDSVASSFAFTARFDPKNEQHKHLFRPLSFHKVEFFNDRGDLFFTGTIISSKFNSKESPDLVSLSGYSLPGILEDCTIPYSAYPLESLSSNLREITQKLLGKFGLTVRIDDSVSKDVDMSYKKTVAEPTETVKEYLSKLAAQRNIVISHDRHGRLLYFRPDPKAKPIRYYDEKNCTQMSLEVDGQSLHSELTILRQPSKEGSNLTPVDTINNPMISKYRPTVQKLTSGDDTSTKKSVENYLADELKAIKVKIELNRWDGMVTGDIVEVHNHEIFIFNRTRFMVESTTINETADGRTMSIDLVLPETFAGGIPKNIFYDNH
jgi:prophage tail gpP-like protein